MRPATALEFFDENLEVNEVQTLTLNASLGSFKLTLDDSTTKTATLLPGISEADLKTAIETLIDLDAGAITGVEVRKDAEDPFYTIIFTGPAGTDINQLEVVVSTLERTVEEALETNLDIDEITSPEDLVGFTLEITRGDAKNKIRLILGGTAAGDVFTLDVSRPWEAGLTDKVPSSASGSEFTIEKTNRNLLVDENEETDFFFLNDTENVTSIGELPTAELILTADRLTGLGMGGDQFVGDLLVDGGIRLLALEEVIINLGPGDNRIIVENTIRGATTINAGGGDDVFFVESVTGHTFLNAGTGADVINVSDGSLLSGINALLTVTGDVPRAVALTLGKGSEPDPVALVGGVDEIQQITVEATDGTFKVGLDGFFTAALDHDVSGADMQTALQALVETAFGVDGAVTLRLVSRRLNWSKMWERMGAIPAPPPMKHISLSVGRAKNSPNGPEITTSSPGLSPNR